MSRECGRGTYRSGDGACGSERGCLRNVYRRPASRPRVPRLAGQAPRRRRGSRRGRRRPPRAPVTSRPLRDRPPEVVSSTPPGRPRRHRPGGCGRRLARGAGSPRRLPRPLAASRPGRTSSRCYHAAVKVRRRAWQGQEIPVDDEGWSPFASSGLGPHEEAEQSELLDAIRDRHRRGTHPAPAARPRRARAERGPDRRAGRAVADNAGCALQDVARRSAKAAATPGGVGSRASSSRGRRSRDGAQRASARPRPSPGARRARGRAARPASRSSTATSSWSSPASMRTRRSPGCGRISRDVRRAARSTRASGPWSHPSTLAR